MSGCEDRANLKTKTSAGVKSETSFSVKVKSQG